MLQQQDVVPKLRKQLVKRILDHLISLSTGSDDDKAAFAKIDNVFGGILREGLVSEQDSDLRSKVAKIARFRSTWTEVQEGGDDVRTSLDEYVSRMAEGQKGIYYVTAPTLSAAKNAPQIEGFQAKGFEVLLFGDPVDEWVASHYSKHGDHDLISVAKGESDLASEDDKKKLDEQTKSGEDFLKAAHEAVADDIEAVRFTSRLKDSPCCLVGSEHQPSPHMEELLRRSGQAMPGSKRSLELNPNHALVQRLQALHGAGKNDDVKQWISVLRDQAIVAEGGRLANASGFAKSIQDLLMQAVPAAAGKSAG